MNETELLHTLDIEAYEAALDAATKSLRKSDLVTDERLARLAGEDGVVAEAAKALLDSRRDTAATQALVADMERDGLL
jgi:multidrug resistance efflux pump